ncbi:hypothetical protein HCN51_54955 [Nonomuraea sp. FMUSA5-5]|uniref:Uncharacterized protein n=1 Tax=Nonomuraea composti TaxID=2720023 RepID=A0ABX1BRL7_9ACTN|nr:hypothetical protein [Nonomuraea sp. FMUSA5-5]NJP98431.1 hypothetical protein [Nonomuraea sp. FMUSA5-5]
MPLDQHGWNYRQAQILLPSEPRHDLIELAHSQDIVVLWPAKQGYGASRPGFEL